MGEMLWVLRSVLAPERGIPPSSWNPAKRRGRPPSGPVPKR